MREKIEIIKGLTNKSFKDKNIFYQIKIINEFNHKLDYKILNNFDFVPILIENQNDFSKWEWIDDQNFDFDNHILKKIAQKFLLLHQSNLVFPKNNLKNRIESYIKFIKNNHIENTFVEKNKEIIFKILDDTKIEYNCPTHNDLRRDNILFDGKNIYFVDWEYATMGNLNFDLAYFIESNFLNSYQEKIFLDYYSNVDLSLLKKFKIIYHYIFILWVLNHPNLSIPIDNSIKKFNDLIK